MTDKELMQEALKWHDHIKVLANDHADDELYQTRSKVFDWLIEQAEKAEKFRKALEFYADKDIYEPVLISEAQCIDGNWVEPASHEPPTIYFDEGEIARKVLEGENNE